VNPKRKHGQTRIGVRELESRNKRVLDGLHTTIRIDARLLDQGRRQTGRSSDTRGSFPYQATARLFRFDAQRRFDPSGERIVYELHETGGRIAFKAGAQPMDEFGRIDVGFRGYSTQAFTYDGIRRHLRTEDQ